MNPHLTVRLAVANDYPRYAALFPELGVDDPIPSEEVFTSRLLPTTIVTERDGAVVGYAYFQRLNDTVYVRNVVTDPGHRRRGVGRVLMQELERRARAAGATRWCLNVKPENVAARALYEEFGMTVAYAAVALRFAWEVVEKLPADPAETRSLEPAEDATVEARFELPRGLIEDARQRPRHHVIGVYSGTDALGVACFSPGFPGAFPFRVARVGLARPLLEACRALALPELNYMQVVVEDDAALAATLIEHGAGVRTEIVHYRGELVA